MEIMQKSAGMAHNRYGQIRVHRFPSNAKNQRNLLLPDLARKIEYSEKALSLAEISSQGLDHYVGCYADFRSYSGIIVEADGDYFIKNDKRKIPIREGDFLTIHFITKNGKYMKRGYSFVNN